MRAVYVIYCFLILVFFTACKEKSVIYEIDQVTVLPNNAGKDKEKTSEQYVNILYANLFQQALSPSQQVDLAELITSIGDKQIAYETIIAKFMKDPSVSLPSNSEMRNDVGKFVSDMYRRFYVREPTQAEKTFFVNYINSRPNISPEHIYFAIATSNEYYFY